MKSLKILLGNNTLSLLAGSETWTYTLARQLKKAGHFVACYSPTLGIISEKLQKEDIPCYNDVTSSTVRPFSFVLEEHTDHNYDVIIANHNHVVEYLRAAFPKTPIISTIHGIIHIAEGPNGETQKAPEHPALEAGVNQFVAVSEEVKKKLHDDYNIDSMVIRNFFDLEKFASLPAPFPVRPKRFLLNTNYSGKGDDVVEVVREAAKHFGAQVIAIGENFSPTIDTTRAIRDADVVFGMGRSVLEGVAAGRLGIVHGRWGTGGPVIESNIEELRAVNFSGRNSGGKLATPEELIEMIERYYTPHFLEWGKSYIARDHNAVFAADAYIRLARELTGEAINTTAREKAVDPAARPFRLASKTNA